MLSRARLELDGRALVLHNVATPLGLEVLRHRCRGEELRVVLVGREQGVPGLVNVTGVGEIRDRVVLLVRGATGEADDLAPRGVKGLDELDHTGGCGHLIRIEPRLLLGGREVEVHRPVLHVVRPQGRVVGVEDGGGLRPRGQSGGAGGGDLGCLRGGDRSDVGDVRRGRLIGDTLRVGVHIRANCLLRDVPVDEVLTRGGKPRRSVGIECEGGPRRHPRLIGVRAGPRGRLGLRGRYGRVGARILGRTGGPVGGRTPGRRGDRRVASGDVVVSGGAFLLRVGLGLGARRREREGGDERDEEQRPEGRPPPSCDERRADDAGGKGECENERDRTTCPGEVLDAVHRDHRVSSSSSS
ncbi:Uncharacterised protein [Chlamydia trachomatis]|nr:Uncharacterised protein [Chlamydia trachomatis]